MGFGIWLAMDSTKNLRMIGLTLELAASARNQRSLAISTRDVYDDDFGKKRFCYQASFWMASRGRRKRTAVSTG